MKSNHTFFRAVLWIICIYHVVLGVALNLPSDLVFNITTNLLGITKAPTDQVYFVARILGIYMIIFGVGMGLGAWDPVKNRSLLTCGVILILIRTVQRLAQADYAEEVFGVASGRNWGMVAALAGFAIVVLVFRLILLKEMKDAEPA